MIFNRDSNYAKSWRSVILNGEIFFSQVTDKTRADVKGGTLIQYGGRLRLLEVAQVILGGGSGNHTFLYVFWESFGNHLFQVPKDHMDEFMDVKKFNVFNTNNLWISMPAIQRVVREKALDMEIIVNPVIKHCKNQGSFRSLYLR